MAISLESIIHHGVEAVAFVTFATAANSKIVGTTLPSGFGSACVAYTVGKVTYLGLRMFLNTCAPDWSKNTKRTISWVGSLLAGGGALQQTLDKVACKTIDVLTTTGITLGVSAISIGVRALADMGYKSGKI